MGPGLCGNAPPWEEVGALRSIPEGDEYAGAFGIYPLQGMGRWLSGCPRVAAGPQPWAALLIPFGEKRRFVDKSRGFQTRYLFRVCDQIKSEEIKKCLELHRI